MPSRRRSAIIAYVVVYMLTMALIVTALLLARRNLLEQYGPEQIEEWQRWKADTAHRAIASPVERRPVRSDEPPLLVLVRDYFAPIVVTCLAISTVLYWFLALALRGAWRGSAITPLYEARR